MVSIRRQLMGLGFVAASSVVAMGAAHAMNGQTNIKVDGGPLGQLEMSGGMAGFGYVLDNSATSTNSGVLPAAMFLQLQKNTGIVQFNIRVGKHNGTDGITLGVQPGGISFKGRKAGILDLGYVTIAPTDSPVTFSVGDLGGLEGYESGTAWNNVSLMTTSNDWVETGNQYGVGASYNKGPISATLQFGDNSETKVFNFLEGLGSYSFDSNNVLSAYFGINLGRTGIKASGGEGSQYTPNSTVYGGYYSWTQGNLNLVPEVQYVYDKIDHKIGIDKFTSNFGAVLLGDYTFANTPYSVGGFVSWEKSIGSNYTWYLTPNDEAISFAVSPTWQYKYLYVRANVGYVHLMHSADGEGIGRDNKKSQVVGALETGFVF